MMANRPLDRSWDLSSVARYRKTILSFSFFICIAGVALAGWLQSYRTVIQEITTSRPAPEFDDGKLAFTSVGYGQFVSAEPAGTAFLGWRFNRPVRLQYVTQGFNIAPDPANAMRRVALEFKNAEGQWMQVSTAQWEELPAALHGLTGVAADSGVPSTEWRIRALQAGEADTVNMGWAIPEIERRPGMAGRIENLSLDGVVLGAFLLATFLLAFAFPHVGGLILFAGGCAGVFMIVNGIVFGLLDLPLAFTPDSGTYMTWPPHPQRMPGMNLVNTALLKLLNFHGLLIFQINMMLLSYFAALAMLGSATRRFWPFAPFTLAPVFWGNFVTHGAAILTEPWFMTGLLLGCAGLLSLVFGAGRRVALIAALGLILAVSVKAVGVVLLVPAALTYRFVPGSVTRRRGLMAVVLLPPAAIYLTMCFYSYTLTGRFSPTVGGGYSLIGHVAWMLDPEDLPEQYRELGREKVKELQALYNAIPPYSKPDAYVDYTLNRYNAGLYSILVPSFVARIIALTPPYDPDSGPGGASAASLDVRTNEFFGAWARAAVARRPLDYAAHCILHFWGLWRDSLRQIYPVGDSRRLLLAAGFDLSQPEPHRTITAPNDYYQYIDGWRERNATTILAQLQYKLISYYRGSRSALQLILMSMALVLSFLYLLPRNYSPRLAAAIVWALFINAYFAGHCLFQVTLVRYGEVIVPLLPLLLGLMLGAIGQSVAKWSHRNTSQKRASETPERLATVH